jgi:hypothetical protein
MAQWLLHVTLTFKKATFCRHICLSYNSHKKQRFFPQNNVDQLVSIIGGRLEFSVKMSHCEWWLRYGPPSQQYPAFSTPLDPSRSNRHKPEASCHLLAANTWTTIHLHWDKSFCAAVEKIRKCQWWVRVGMMLTICSCNHLYTEVRMNFLASECLALPPSPYHETPLYTVRDVTDMLKNSHFVSACAM